MILIIYRSEGFPLREYVIPARVDGGGILQENSSAAAHKGIGVRDYTGFLDYFGLFFVILMDFNSKAATAAADEFSWGIQPPSTRAGITYPVRIIPHSDIGNIEENIGKYIGNI